MKKAAVFDPYLNILGGGEVYTSSVITALLKKGYEVELFWNERSITEKISSFLGIDISKANINKSGFLLFKNKGNITKKIKASRKYDVFFYLSDGSIPLLFSKNNILHFQTPYKNVNGTSITNSLKLKLIHNIICNSKFTKNVIDREFGVNSKILYPPININPMKKKKSNIILSVGRFTQTLHNKRQDILVETFIEMIDKGLSNWKLRLVGSSSEKEGKEMVERILTKAKGYPIQLITNVTHNRLVSEYEKAKIFWHAAGFDVDQKKYPEQVEHFGIATVEAMAAGCVPVVINKGGQPEIVKDGENGYLWESQKELIQKTIHLLKDEDELRMVSENSKKIQKQFSKETFCTNMSNLF